jgi:hypothetical protein
MSTATEVMTCAELGQASLAALLARYGLRLRWLPDHRPIPGSYWGECEAGLIGDELLVRADTPVHSALHEAGHYICMDPARRASLHTDAGGDDAEEAAVCYLQILLADELPGVGRERLCADMDTWGYSFRLGLAGTWFAQDAVDARDWLLRHGLISLDQQPGWRLRQN